MRQRLGSYVHNNLGIPLTFKNYITKKCSVLGISMIRSAHDDDDDGNENTEYINPSLLANFDKRWDEVVALGRFVKAEDFRKNKTLKEFCDRYECKFQKQPETNDKVLDLSLRSESFGGTHHAVRLVPHLTSSKANPKSGKYWTYCKHLCLWLYPCEFMRDLMPTPLLVDKDLENYWIEKYEELHSNFKNLLPNWVKRQYSKYIDNESSSDDEGLEMNEVRGVQNVHRAEDASDDTDDDLDGDPRARRVDTAFYQNIEDQAHLRNEDEPEVENETLTNLINLSNPRGEDCMKWAKDQVIPDYNVIMQRLNSLKNKEAVSKKTTEVCLNDNQRLFKNIVHTWAERWALANKGEGDWPEKPLRLFMCGGPGTGKSCSTKAGMDCLGEVLGENFTNTVRQATPTGCASFQMSAGATTVHKLLGINIYAKRGDMTENAIKSLVDKFKHGLCILVLDEFSMESRGMLALILDRLKMAHIDLAKVGIILIGDPAQLLPIAGEPCWSIKMKNKSLSECSEDSIVGLSDFRSLFRMPRLEQLPNFGEFKKNTSVKNPNELQRKQISEFTYRALYGDYDAVFLHEIKRGVVGDPLSYEFITELIPSCRFGKITERKLMRMRDVFATQDDIARDDKWLQSRMVHGHHYHSANNPARISVESDNLRTMFNLASRLGNKPIVHFKASHMPQNKSPALEMVSPKEFQGMLKDFVAYEGMPLMLLQNIAPQYALYNGSIVEYVGVLFLTDDIEVKLKSSELLKVQIKNLVVMQPLDLRGGTTGSRLHQLPKDAVLISINNLPVSSDNDVKGATETSDVMLCRFKLPQSPPSLPDFVIVKCDAYKDRGGPNILGFPGAENLVPIPYRKMKREGKVLGKKGEQYRIGFMLEGALAVTAYKLQGHNEKCAKIQMKEFAHVPGLFNVAISRVKHPKDNFIPEGQFPTALDINLQRLDPLVIEAEIFERVIKILSLKTLCHYSIETGGLYGQTWTTVEMGILNCLIEISFEGGSLKSIPYMMEIINEKLSRDISEDELKRVISKIDLTEAKILKDEIPYLKDSERNVLISYQKQKKKRAR